MSSLYDQILGLEESTWRALQSNGAALVPFLTKDAIMQFPMGLKVSSKTEPSVQDILHSSAFVPWKQFKLKKVDVTPVGAEGAVISYRAIATRASADPKDTRDAEFDALCSSVWRKEGGTWMMCFHQQTMTGEGL
ncbi:Putative NTF2-like domain superfamily protein [Septoria linicola]|uniref:NTF2-like domain superfamily protein n=1 Tax=Septoria linicola TaxID=215465 RepID=A0A9Q9EGA3_9PEZI|nr:putative NTF2-like domain superfamily protein [Septoria linicola]USW49770.1 Putative NTF2-like domain superfamily protein [Septoria linicola]